MPRMKPHLHWCDFVFSIFPMPYHTCRAHNHILVGVILCSASSPLSTCHTSQTRQAQKDTIVGVLCSSSFFHPPHMPNTKRHPHSDGHGCPVGNFFRSRTRTRRKPVLQERVRDSRTYGNGIKRDPRERKPAGLNHGIIQKSL